MYEAYWGLDTKPFEPTSDPRFYYPGEAHQGALLKLRYVLESRRGGALLTGAAGLGKTLLVQSLFRQLPESLAPRVHLVFPQLPPDQLLSYLADELTNERPRAGETSLHQCVRRIQTALTEIHEAGRHAVLAVDEAQLVCDPVTLETLRLLLNFEVDAHPGLTLLLIGQPSLLPTMQRMPGLEERLAVKCLLRPLHLEESISYISHRLTAAGARRAVFTPAAMETVHHLAHGVPRKINRLCDLSLLIAFAEERTEIGPEQIEAVSGELITVAPE